MQLETVGYIVPHKFMNIQSGAELRGLLSAHRNVKKIMHFGTHQVFENRSTYTCILIMSKQPNDEFQIGFVQNLNQFLFEHTVECATYAAPYLSRQPWAFLPQSLINQLHRAEENCEPLANLADIFVGVQTSADNIYIIHVDREDEDFVYSHEENGTEFQLEKGILSEGILFLPYWLLTYEEMLSLMLDRSDNNAPNQAMMFSNQVIKHKKDFLHGMGLEEMEANITLDSPIPYSLDKMIDCLTALDQEMVPGARAGAEKKGPYNGQFTRFIQRLETKRKDKRLNFMFSREESLLKYDYMDELCCKLMLPAQNGKKGVKIIDFSEVPSDILPLIVSLIARVVFSVQQWSQVGERHPIAIFCDEAHLYIPAHTEKSIDDASLVTFERISKEGRKYGVGLVVISQRPSEVNRTVLSQSNNFIAMRLTNADDQAVVKRLLPDSLGDYAEMLPILDIGEALIVGDASLLPSRIRIAPPKLKPRSATIDFWDEWAKETSAVNIRNAIEALRKQSK